MNNVCWLLFPSPLEVSRPSIRRLTATDEAGNTLLKPSDYTFYRKAAGQHAPDRRHLFNLKGQCRKCSCVSTHPHSASGRDRLQFGRRSRVRDSPDTGPDMKNGSDVKMASTIPSSHGCRKVQRDCKLSVLRLAKLEAG